MAAPAAAPTVAPPAVTAPASAPPQPQPSPPSPLVLTDTIALVARQDSIAPLLVKLSAVAAAAASMPRPVVEAARRLLEGRLDLSRGIDATSLRQAVLRAGVIAEPGVRPEAGDLRANLLGLRGLALAALGESAIAPVAPVRGRPAPPLEGHGPRVPPSVVPDPGLDADPARLLRDLAGQAEAVLSRLKLLQLASTSPDPLRGEPAPRQEFRLELPLLFNAQAGMMSLVIDRDREQRQRQTERGWRLRFAMRFAATGEVGADVVLFGRSATVGLWASEPCIADAMEEMLPELAPALARHGLELAGLRLRREAPAAGTGSAGQLLDSSR